MMDSQRSQSSGIESRVDCQKLQKQLLTTPNEMTTSVQRMKSQVERLGKSTQHIQEAVARLANSNADIGDIIKKRITLSIGVSRAACRILRESAEHLERKIDDIRGSTERLQSRTDILIKERSSDSCKLNPRYEQQVRRTESLEH